MTQKDMPQLTPTNRLQERVVQWMSETAPGRGFAGWLGRTLGLPELRQMQASLHIIPWTPLRRPLAQATVALITTGGVHLRTDAPFDLQGDASFRRIPCTAEAGDLCISHEKYDRRDAMRDINLVFPLQRLRELEAEGIIGHVAEIHYGFGFCLSPGDQTVSARAVGLQLKQADVDLALLVPAWLVCTRSVGLLAREIEACGVTTVCLGLVRELALAVKAPRMLLLHWPFGHALGEPGNVNQQRTILHDMFSFARIAPRAGLVVELPYRWKRETYPSIADWTIESEALARALAQALRQHTP